MSREGIFPLKLVMFLRDEIIIIKQKIETSVISFLKGRQTITIFLDQISLIALINCPNHLCDVETDTNISHNQLKQRSPSWRYDLAVQEMLNSWQSLKVSNYWNLNFSHRCELILEYSNRFIIYKVLQSSSLRFACLKKNLTKLWQGFALSKKKFSLILFLTCFLSFVGKFIEIALKNIINKLLYIRHVIEF